MVGRKDADVATRVVKYQGSDPGTKLLLGQTGAKALLAKVPKGIHRGWRLGNKRHGIRMRILLSFEEVIHRRDRFQRLDQAGGGA